MRCRQMWVLVRVWKLSVNVQFKLFYFTTFWSNPQHSDRRWDALTTKLLRINMCLSLLGHLSLHECSKLIYIFPFQWLSLKKTRPYLSFKVCQKAAPFPRNLRLRVHFGPILINSYSWIRIYDYTKYWEWIERIMFWQSDCEIYDWYIGTFQRMNTRFYTYDNLTLPK